METVNYLCFIPCIASCSHFIFTVLRFMVFLSQIENGIGMHTIQTLSQQTKYAGSACEQHHYQQHAHATPHHNFHDEAARRCVTAGRSLRTFVPWIPLNEAQNWWLFTPLPDNKEAPALPSSCTLPARHTNEARWAKIRRRVKGIIDKHLTLMDRSWQSVTIYLHATP